MKNIYPFHQVIAYTARHCIGPRYNVRIKLTTLVWLTMHTQIESIYIDDYEDILDAFREMEDFDMKLYEELENNLMNEDRDELIDEETGSLIVMPIHDSLLKSLKFSHDGNVSLQKIQVLLEVASHTEIKEKHDEILRAFKSKDGFNSDLLNRLSHKFNLEKAYYSKLST